MSKLPADNKIGLIFNDNTIAEKKISKLVMGIFVI